MPVLRRRLWHWSFSAGEWEMLGACHYAAIDAEEEGAGKICELGGEYGPCPFAGGVKQGGKQYIEENPS